MSYHIILTLIGAIILLFLVFVFLIVCFIGLIKRKSKSEEPININKARYWVMTDDQLIGFAHNFWNYHKSIKTEDTRPDITNSEFENHKITIH